MLINRTGKERMRMLVNARLFSHCLMIMSIIVAVLATLLPFLQYIYTDSASYIVDWWTYFLIQMPRLGFADLFYIYLGAAIQIGLAYLLKTLVAVTEQQFHQQQEH